MLTQFRSQFVPLKIETNGADWNQWAKKYPPMGRGIPIIYVIRADGEKLYGRSGALAGPQLPQMMLDVLKECGRQFNDAEYAALLTAVDKVKVANEKNDKVGAVGALRGVKKLGKPGELSNDSYSTVARELDELINATFETTRAEIDEARNKILEDPKTAFEAVVVLVSAQRTYAGLPQLNTILMATNREIAKNPELKAYVKPAELLVKARVDARSKSASQVRRAAKSYERLIARYEGTPAAEVARAELAENFPDSKSVAVTDEVHQESATKAEYRTWTDSTGKYTVEAVLLQLKDGTVYLKNRKGREITLPLRRLSVADQKHLRSQ